MKGLHGFLRKNVEAYASWSRVGGRESQCWDNADEGITMYSRDLGAGPRRSSENVFSYCCDGFIAGSGARSGCRCACLIFTRACGVLAAICAVISSHDTTSGRAAAAGSALLTRSPCSSCVLDATGDGSSFGARLRLALRPLDPDGLVVAAKSTTTCSRENLLNSANAPLRSRVRSIEACMSSLSRK